VRVGFKRGRVRANPKLEWDKKIQVKFSIFLVRNNIIAIVKRSLEE
jgi:hypothetical protein